MTIWITSDLHLGHSKIKDFCPWRPGKDLEEMNQILIQNWKARVHKRDVVYVLGDFSFKAGMEQTKKWLDQLPGRKILISGNHDRRADQMLKCGFDEVQENTYIWLGDSNSSNSRKIFLSHYPYLPSFYSILWNRLRGKNLDARYLHKRIRNQGYWLLCGHTHKRDNWNGKRQIHIGVDSPHSNFSPIPHTKILQIINETEAKETFWDRFIIYLKRKLII